MRKAWKNTGQDSAEGQIRFWKIFALYLGGEGGKERDTMSLVSSVNDRIFMKIQATRLGRLGGQTVADVFSFRFCYYVRILSYPKPSEMYVCGYVGSTEQCGVKVIKRWSNGMRASRTTRSGETNTASITGS